MFVIVCGFYVVMVFLEFEGCFIWGNVFVLGRNFELLNGFLVLWKYRLVIGCFEMIFVL